LDYSEARSLTPRYEQHRENELGLGREEDLDRFSFGGPGGVKKHTPAQENLVEYPTQMACAYHELSLAYGVVSRIFPVICGETDEDAVLFHRD
jgi:hypothetical protein